ncbi:MAG: endonuclease/exonuclease/phosphatase family protein, partial [Myxococcota bacterium]
RCLVYNVKLLPPHVKLGIRPRGRPIGFWERGSTRLSDKVRAGHLVRAMLATDSDVICLQEVFDEGARRRFTRAFEAAGYEVFAKASAGDLFNEDSGLFFASRMPIVWHRFDEFSAKAGPDAWSDKGVTCVRLDMASRWGNRPHALYVFNTHLQGGSQAAVRELQLAQIRHFVQRCLGEPKAGSSAAMLFGDLNVSAEHEARVDTMAGPTTALVPTMQYRTMRALLDQPRDLWRERNHGAGFTRDGTVNRTMTRRVDNAQHRIDYALAFDAVPEESPESEGAALVSLRCLAAEVLPFNELIGGRKHHLSDHFGVLVELRP